MQNLLLLILPCRGLLLSVLQEMVAINSMSKHGGWKEKGGHTKSNKEQNCFSCHWSIFLGFWIESSGKHLIVSINTHLVLGAPEWFSCTDLPKHHGSIRELLGCFHWQLGYFVGGAPREEDERGESREIKLIFVNYKALLDTFSFQPVNFRFSSVRGKYRCSPDF